MTEDNKRLSYLIDIYKLYQVHVNTMFNYFMVLCGLIINAYIQSMQNPQLRSVVAPFISGFGAFIAVVSLLIYLRSRQMLDTIEARMSKEEIVLFGEGEGFLNARSMKPRWFLRHWHQFIAIYTSFILAFLSMCVYAIVSSGVV
ncbi:hypothetical protein [Methylosinus sp. C49]|uniref:hypothetical protein n=1 Tax=Methylosinus sp. C49 TaxID=2699395 RepID=UPI00137AC9EB|nr:hypothetical protein [Methylosinus sp. C49]